METDNMETSPISMLPEDVLLEIFEFLKYYDRNNAKLVCKSWLRILKRIYFTRMETFFFPPYYDLSTIGRVVDECGRYELDLKFKNRRFLKNTKFFWEQCGHKIKSLEFHNCSFHPDTMLQIFEHCVNLEAFFMFGFCEISFHRKRRLSQKSFRLFKVDHFVREKLSILEFGILPHNTSDLICIASIFPNLKRLGFSLRKNVDAYLSTLQNLLQTRKLDIEKLDVCLINGTIPEDVCRIQKFISSNRTAEVALFMNFQPELFNDSNIRRISSPKFLTAVMFLTNEYDEYNRPIDATLLARLVDALPKLRYLEFPLNFTTINDFCILWSALVKSHLVDLKCSTVSQTDAAPQFLSDSVHEIESFLNSLTRNYTVRHLRFEQSYGDEYNFFALKYFQGVYDLETEGAKPATIFQYQSQLRSLQLLVLPSQNVISSQICIESIEHMDVCNNAVEMFSLYRFPNLKYLTMNFDHYFYHDELLSQEIHRGKSVQDLLNDDLQKLASILPLESPKLKGVELFGSTDGMDTFEFFLQFCRNFKNLYYVTLICESQIAPKKEEMARKVTELVNQSSSIKLVWIHVAEVKILYFFNRVEGRYEFFNRHHQTFYEFYPKMKDLWEKDR